ncbi:hypothetical protein BGZ59_009129 [Podila verticillata]|nr:hypothetical protein BGZ59_009129 [Podila verticillata]
MASKNVKSDCSYLSHDKPNQNKKLFDRESSFSSRPRSSYERSSGNHRQEYPPRSSSHGTYRNGHSSGLSHARDRPQLTPSQTFMEERNKALATARYISERNARKVEREKSLMTLAMKKNPDASPTTYKKPVVAGDISELFAPGSTQDREVHPGDFVEIRRQGKPIHAIYVQDFDQSEGRLQSSSVGQGDQLFPHRTADVVFRIPGYVFMDKIVRQIGHWDVQTNAQAPPAGAGKAAVVFADEATTLMGMFYTKFNTVYDQFWNQRKQTSFTTPDAAKFVFSKEGSDAAPVTLQELYATHMYLTQDINLTKFIPSTAVRWTGEFTMRAPKDVLLVETVVSWLRTNDKRMVQFVEKAKKLVHSSRGGDKSFWKEVQFTLSDQTIIEFVRQTAFSGYDALFMTPHLTYLPKLLRPLEAYDDIDPKTAFDFLNEIGVWPKWYNMEINRSAITFTSDGLQEQAILDRIRQLNPDSLKMDFDRDLEAIKNKQVTRSEGSKANVSARSPLVLQSATEMYKVDPCDSIRHDFGDQAVYAIDDPSASELDDAFCIEPVPVTTLTPQPSTWIHVHVADPTAILPPLHEMSLLAAERIQTAYLPERTWPMLPRELTEDALSLKNDGRPKKVMTFSARLENATGDILEYKVRPGIVRKVITLNYDDVDDVLSWDRVHGGREEGDRVRNSMMVSPIDEANQGSKAPKRTYYRDTKGSVSSEDTVLIQELQQMQKVSQQHMDRRLHNGAFNFSLGRPAIEITPYPLPAVAESQWQRPIDYQHQWQEPQISCRLDPGFASPARMMVAEYMVLAGQVAALFSGERGLPMMYRNQPSPDEKYRGLFEETIRNKSNPRTGMVEMVDMLPLRPYIKGAQISVVPEGHWSMGIKGGYCKVTSPLRRYSDMVSHWQMKAALLGEGDLKDPVARVFDLETLVPLTSTIRDRERLLGMLEARSVKFWLFEMLRRRQACGISNVFEGVIMNPTADGYNVISSQLGFQCVVKYMNDATGPPVVTLGDLTLEEEGGDKIPDPMEVMTGLAARNLKIGSRVLFEVNNVNPQRPWIGAKHLSAVL